jgi:hypothetical protein
MNMRYTIPLIAVIILFLMAYLGVQVPGLKTVFGIIIPYLAILTFILGFAIKIIGWSRSAVPFRIPTTAGQHKSLAGFNHSKLECPVTNWQVVGRMALEILTFRSLFRNTRMKLANGPGDSDLPVPVPQHPHEIKDRGADFLSIGNLFMGRRAGIPLCLFGRIDPAFALFCRAGAIFRAAY